MSLSVWEAVTVDSLGERRRSFVAASMGDALRRLGGMIFRTTDSATVTFGGVTRVEIFEEIGLGRRATVAVYDVAETITPWFPEAPPEVTAAIATLQHQLCCEMHYADTATYLGLIVTAPSAR